MCMLLVVPVELETQFLYICFIASFIFSFDFRFFIFQESKINIGVRSIFCVVEKAEKGWWKKLLRGDEKAPHYLKVDWDKWVDEDEDTGMFFRKLNFGFLKIVFI